MRIGILTITPNIGYGGIMQSYALQQILESLGAQVTIINHQYKHTIRERVSFLLHGMVRFITKGEFVKLTHESDYIFRSQNVRKFHDRHLKLSKKVYPGKSLHNFINNNLDIVVVGSDQVWRPSYIPNIYDYYFDGISSKVLKLSYAASFGTNVWEYTQENTKKCTKLLSAFAYISVREHSGISFIKHYFGENFNVHWDLDPTLLLRKEHYMSLFENVANKSNNLFTYILDPTEDKETLAHTIGRKLGLKVNSFNTRAENGMGAKLTDRIAPNVEDWLCGFYNSDFIITDSFHGTVFSIIFNKPFVVYINKERGVDRFDSLLSLIGLKERMIYSSDSISNGLLESQINWDNINQILESRRTGIIKTLKQIIK